MTETETQKLQREITERQARIAQLARGDRYSPSADPDAMLGHGDNACDQAEGA